MRFDIVFPNKITTTIKRDKLILSFDEQRLLTMIPCIQGALDKLNREAIKRGILTRQCTRYAICAEELKTYLSCRVGESGYALKGKKRWYCKGKWCHYVRIQK